MVNAARRYGRVVQVGTQQRSMPVFQQAMEIVHSGKIGQVTAATSWLCQNWTKILDFPEPPPKDLDWDLFLGPAPKVPYSPQRQYSFRSWHDYARGGGLTNWGVHLFDILHWGVQQDQPLNVQAVGGCYTGWPQSDDYETIESIFEYEGCTLTWEQRHAQNYQGLGLGMKFQGTSGQLLVDRNTYKVVPKKSNIKPYDGPGEEDWANPDHHNNFFHCIRTRQRPVADIEQGHRSTIPMLIAGIALKVRRRLNWDGQAERFIGDEQANRYLSRAYRAPWHL
jgi:predicted dehydrogenase